MHGITLEVLEMELKYFNINNILGVKMRNYVRFQVLTAASMKLRIFWDVLPCS
jgi:hypothetical protein